MKLVFSAWDKASFSEGATAAIGVFDYDKNNPEEAVYVFNPTTAIRIEDVSFVNRRNDMNVTVTYESGEIQELRLDHYDIEIEGDLFTMTGKTTIEDKEDEAERLANKIREICFGARYVAPPIP